jgi:RNA polymerase sigma factor (sigma-70 family)
MPRVGTDEELSAAEADRHLLQGAVEGDDRALTAIFDRYNQRLYRYCLAIVANAQDAQDALQNTMVKVLRALPEDERPIKLKPWLYRIAHNESIELLRHRRDARQLDAELVAPGSGLAEEAASRERLRRLISDLNDLPQRQRGALVMRELGGLDFAEIGAALGISSRVARQTLYEARLSLRGMDEGREMSCEVVTRTLSDGDGRVIRRRDLRAHLHDCRGCSRFREEIEVRELDLAALSPLPAVVLARLLSGHGVGGGAAGAAGALGGGGVQSLGSAAVLKAVATVAVVAAVGAGTVYQGGLVDTGRASDGSPRAVQAARSGVAYGQVATLGRHSASPVVDAEHVAGLRGKGRVGVSSNVGSTRRPASPVASEMGSPAQEKVAVNSPNSKNEAVNALAPDSQGDSSPSPYGKGRGEQPPVASQHGSQTGAEYRNSEHGPGAAAEHKGSEHGQQTAAEHKAEHGPASESHPAHPSHPAGPGAEPEPPESSAVGVPEVEAAAEPASGEEAPTGHETGKGHGHGHE